MTLIEWLERLEHTSEVWVDLRRRWTAGDILRQVEVCRSQLAGVSGARVVVELENTVDALVWMLALDGVAMSAFLVPASLAARDDYPKLKQQFNPDLTINEQRVTVGPGGRYLRPCEADQVPCETEWVLATSGTTGTPKLVTHTGEGLIGTAKKDLTKGKMFVWGLVFEAFRFAGLQVVLQALVGGSRLVICDSQDSVHNQAAWLRKSGVNALSATPTYWRKLLMSGVVGGHHFRQITLGGEAADQSILDALKAAFPDARIVHIYASTEAGAGFSVTDGRAGFPLEYLHCGVSGRELAIGDNGTLRIEADPSQHYEPCQLDESGMLDTGDLVEILGNRVVFIGRRSGTINVGGNKVVPEQVEVVIRQVEGVADAVVRAKISSVTGQLVVADVVPLSADTNTANLRKAVVDHCKLNLERYQVPALIRFVEHIDSNSSGKATRV